MAKACIYPGRVWLDTEGKRIQAHGGSVITIGHTFYWYGENKEKTDGKNGIWHWGVRAYRSEDLCSWTDYGLIIPPVTEDPASTLHPTQCMDRPHILYNRLTDRYVCWLKIMEKDGTQSETILTAPEFLGPYTIVKEHFRPLGMSAGDFDLVSYPDGRAFYYFERVHSELICAELTPDYTDVTGVYSAHFPNGHPPFVREAPAFFERNGHKYLFTSGTTGYHPNPSEAAWAEEHHGPWTVLGDAHPEDPSRTSCNSQISSVFRHPFKRDLYIALADRWLPTLPEDCPEGTEGFRSGARSAHIQAVYDYMCHPDPSYRAGREDPCTEFDRSLFYPPTMLSDYVWLPVRFDGDRPYLVWSDAWSPADFD